MVKRILGGILFICIGIFLMIASIKMIFVDDPKAKKLLSEAVYVTTDTVDPANDGKAVIVSAPFKLVEPAYDAYCHQQQQWQYQYRHPACNPVVKSLAFFKTCGV